MPVAISQWRLAREAAGLSFDAAVRQLARRDAELDPDEPACLYFVRELREVEAGRRPPSPVLRERLEEAYGRP